MGLRVAKSVASQNKFRGSDRNRGDAGLFESGCEEPGAEAFAKGGEAIEKFSAGGDASVNGDFVEKVASQELQVVAHAKAFKFAELQIVKHIEVKIQEEFGFMAGGAALAAPARPRHGKERGGDGPHGGGKHRRPVASRGRSKQGPVQGGG